MDKTDAISDSGTISPRTKFRPVTWFGLFVGLVLAARVGAMAVFMAVEIPCSVDLTHPEAALVNRAYQIVLGEAPYSDWREWPHAFAPYGPLTYYTVGWMARIWNPYIHPTSLYSIGRGLSLASLAGVCILLILLLRRTGESRWWGLPAIAAYLAWQEEMRCAVNYRPDAPQVLFSLLAVWIAMGGRAYPARVALALLSLSISMWFKPSSWGIAWIIGIWTWRTAGLRRFILAMLLFAVCNLLLALFLDWKWEGRLFLNMIGSLDNGWALGNIVGFLRPMAWIAQLILFGGVGLSVYELIRRANNDSGRILATATVASFAVALPESLKRGAGWNYYLECYALASVVCARWIAQKWKVANASDGTRFARGICFAVMCFALWDSARGLISLRREFPERLETWKEHPLSWGCKNIEGPILAALVPWVALQRPAPPTIMDFVQYGILFQRGKLSDEPLISRVERRDFQMIIFPSPEHMNAFSLNTLLPPRFLPALYANYREVGRKGDISLLAPLAPSSP